jgi:hypothetical protein
VATAMKIEFSKVGIDSEIYVSNINQNGPVILPN